MKVLVIYSHSYQENSRANRVIVDALKAVEGVSVRNLEELYPDGQVDVAAEQAALLEADVIVLQHPIFWFNVPSLLKRWMDTVLHYGFAFGDSYKLEGKKFLQSYTTGSSAQFYLPDHVDVVEAPLRTSAKYCRMDYRGAIGSYGYVGHENTEAAAKEHAERLIAAIKALG